MLAVVVAALQPDAALDLEAPVVLRFNPLHRGRALPRQAVFLDVPVAGSDAHDAGGTPEMVLVGDDRQDGQRADFGRQVEQVTVGEGGGRQVVGLERRRRGRGSCPRPAGTGEHRTRRPSVPTRRWCSAGWRPGVSQERMRSKGWVKYPRSTLGCSGATTPTMELDAVGRPGGGTSRSSATGTRDRHRRRCRCAVPDTPRNRRPGRAGRPGCRGRGVRRIGSA